MLSLPIAFRSAIGVLAPVFSRPMWQHGQSLLTGAVLAPGKRTVTAMLQGMGRRTASDFPPYHRVRHRAVWSPLQARRRLLRLLVAGCLPRGVIVLGLDDTIERRRGAQITAQGISRAPVRSSHAHVVTVSGRRWLGGRVLLPMSWATRVWALPGMTGRCPSERFSVQRSRRHRPLLDRAGQIIRLGRRGVPGREIGWGPDSRVAALAWLALVARWPYGSVSTRLRLDAALSAPPPPRASGQRGRPRLTGKRRPTREAGLADEQTQWSTLTLDEWYGEGPREGEVATDTAVWSPAGKPPGARRGVLMRAPQERCTPPAVLSTPLAHPGEHLRTWFGRRWTMEVTLEAARAQLGRETQRQGQARAIARTTPALLSRYSLMTRTAPLLTETGATGVRSTAWYGKTRPTFSEALAWVRRQWWHHIHFSTSHQKTDMLKRPRTLLERFTAALCYAA